MGLNQSSAGSAKNSALINLHLATGKIGRAGAGPFSLTGQPNAMGGRETGSLANLLPGHREAADPGHRAEVAHYWGVEQLPTSPGLSAIELFDAVHDGRIKALWIACTNPAQSLPDQRKIHEALARCPFVVVQEAFAGTETCQYADLLLPAATWGEKEGSVTNSERRISHVRPAVPALGEARPDWNIVCDFARRLEGQRLRPRKRRPVRLCRQPSALFDEYKLLTRGRDLDLSGLNYALLDPHGPQQWPFRPGAEQGTERLYGDGRFPTINGRARLVAEPYRATQEKRDARYPLTLNTGRLRDQWHGMSRTGTCARLFGHVEEALVHLHPEELRRRQLRDGQLVRLKSRRGALFLPVSADDSVRPGQAFLPMHWGDRFLKGLGINVLTLPAVDPLSRQPELKHARVEVESESNCPGGSSPWWKARSRRVSRPSVRCAKSSTTPASVSPDASAPPCWSALRTSRHPARSGWPESILCSACPMGRSWPTTTHAAPSASACASKKRASSRCGWPAKPPPAPGCANCGKKAAPTSELRRWLLAPLGAAPGNAGAAADKTLCNCLNVSQRRIQGGIAQGLDLDGLKREFGCGTGCGSCVPEIKRLLARKPLAATA